MNSSVRVCSDDAGQDLDPDVGCSFFRRAVASASRHDCNGHRRIEVGSRARAEGIDHAHQRCSNGEYWSRRLAKNIQANGQDKEEGANELADELGTERVLAAATELIRAHNPECPVCSCSAE